MCIYIYIYICISLSLSLYIYIYREREIDIFHQPYDWAGRREGRRGAGPRRGRRAGPTDRRPPLTDTILHSNI